MFPRIIGMACTDESGRLYFDDNGKKKLIARHPNVPAWVSDMDFSLLKRFLATQWQDGTLVVIGSNTYLEAKTLLTQHAARHRTKVLISHPDHYTLVNPLGAPTHCDYPTDDSLSGLRIASQQLCLDRDLRQILVLGGRSVYHAFNGFYDQFTHCRVTTGNQSPDSPGAISLNDILMPPAIHNNIEAPDLENPRYDLTTHLTEEGYTVQTFERQGGTGFVDIS